MSTRHNRTGSASAVVASQQTQNTSSCSSASNAGIFTSREAQVLPGWPARKVPVEIFAEIISYLPRSAVKNMRLVNKEFEQKTSSTFFQVVVVPFRSEIYGITPEPGLGRPQPTWEDEMPQRSIMLQDRGMRVFQGYVP